MTNALWLQEKIRNKDLTVVNIKNAFNVSDLMTKIHDANFINYLVELLGHSHEDGRSEVAPSLDLIHNDQHLHVETLMALGMHVDTL